MSEAKPRPPWVLLVAGVLMFPMVGFLAWQQDWFGAALNLGGGLAVTVYSAYRIVLAHSK